MSALCGKPAVLAALKRACEFAGSQTAFAKLHDISVQYVNDVLVERREPGKAILSALGFERIVSYRRVRA